MEGGKAFYKDPYATMVTYIPLGPLFQRIKRQKSFTEQEACAVLRDVASAISFLHRKSMQYTVELWLSESSVIQMLFWILKFQKQFDFL